MTGIKTILDTVVLLKAIASAKSPSFEDFVAVLEDPPHNGEYRGLRERLRALADMELITLTCHSMSREIRTLKLTELGEERLKEALQPVAERVI